MTKPFRWSVAKREQLGRLIAGYKVEAEDNWPAFLIDVRQAAARILALADTADLAFIGRTPENFFDYLSGIFAGLDDTPRLHLIQFSLRWAGPDGIDSLEAVKRAALFSYFCDEEIDPAALATRPRPLALVDFVAHGGTMQNLVRLLHDQAQHQGADWNVVQQRLRLIGLRVRTHNSPNTYRWQQHQDWLDLIPNAKIKNVSAPASFLWFIANSQPKTTRPHHPERWQSSDSQTPTVTDENRIALALAATLYDVGTTREERAALAALLAKKQQMKQPATRALVMRLRGK